MKIGASILFQTLSSVSSLTTSSARLSSSVSTISSSSLFFGSFSFDFTSVFISRYNLICKENRKKEILTVRFFFDTWGIFNSTWFGFGCFLSIVTQKQWQKFIEINLSALLLRKKSKMKSKFGWKSGLTITVISDSYFEISKYRFYSSKNLNILDGRKQLKTK